MPKKLNLIGNVYGFLKVIEKGKRKGKNMYWVCECICGQIKQVSTTDLTIKNAKSCGCKQYMRPITNKYIFYEDKIGIIVHSKKKGDKEFFIDIEDYDKVNGYNWHIDGKGHVMRNANKSMNVAAVFLHRLLMGIDSNKDFQMVDHIDGNPLNNQKLNLRFATSQENSRNSKIRVNNISGCTGVGWKKDIQKWVAKICVNGKSTYLGAFCDINEAIKVRHEAEIKIFGEFSPLICRNTSNTTENNPLQVN